MPMLVFIYHQKQRTYLGLGEALNQDEQWKRQTQAIQISNTKKTVKPLILGAFFILVGDGLINCITNFFGFNVSNFMAKTT